jgi:hypothetical protein
MSSTNCGLNWSLFPANGKRFQLRHEVEVDAFQIRVPDIFRPQIGGQYAVFHNSNAGSGLFSPEQIMCCHQRCNSSRAQSSNQRGEVVRGLGIETGCWFVQQQRFRFFAIAIAIPIFCRIPFE